ncbi:MAG: hypothetical protein PHT49_07415 [Desulfovibrionales bacterium]|nr:hypothetical protein [Desulfovibrionales bacterium]
MRTDNKYKPGWPPEVYRITVIDDSTKKEYLINLIEESLLKKAIKDTFSTKKEGPWESFISFQLPPGSYRLSAIAGGCTKGVGVAAAMGSFDFPFDILFQVENGECVYLGRLEMTNRKRVSEDERPSGGKLGLLGQELSGFADGTFDVKIYDNFDQDIQNFKEKYPVLSNQVIKKRILPQWKKPENRS